MMDVASTNSMSKGMLADWTPHEVRALVAFIESQRSEQQRAKPYEIALGGRSRSENWEQDRTLIKSLAQAGATWWMEYVPAGELEEMRESVKRGSLRIE